MRVYLEMAQTTQNATWLQRSFEETASDVGFEQMDVEAEGDVVTLHYPHNVPSEIAEAITYEMCDIIGVDEVANFEVSTTGNTTTLTLNWSNVSSVTASDDEEGFDGDYEGEEDDPEEDDDEDDDDLVDDETGDSGASSGKVKKVAGKALQILTNTESQKLITRLHSMACGDDMSQFPAFWQELDKLCSKYRGTSNYKPVAAEDATITLATLYSEGFLEEAKKRKKKGWKEGYGGFLTSFMKAAAGNREVIDKAWTELKDAKLVEIMISLSQKVVEDVMKEREARDLPPSSAEDDTSESEETSTEE